MIEIWRDVKGYEGSYRVSNEGRVKSLKAETELILKQVNSNGYKNVSLSKNGKEATIKVHRLVAEAFISNPLNWPQCGHENDNKTDNRAINLYWTNALENTKHNKVHLKRVYKSDIKRRDREDILVYVQKLILMRDAHEGVWAIPRT